MVCLGLVVVGSGCRSGGALGEDLTPATAQGALYAAFGDSYSAGEGTDSYLPGTASPGVNVCHRSTLAYSQLLVTQQHVASSSFAACSGAVTADVFAPNHNGNKDANGNPEPAQLCQAVDVDGVQACGTGRAPALGPDTTAVSLTIGGNDAGYAKVVESCIFGGSGRYRVGLPGRGCRYDPTTIKRTLQRISALAGHGHDTSPYGSDIHPIASVLTTIHAVAPNAHVYIAGYPKIFQPDSAADCEVGEVTEGAKSRIALKVTADDARAVDNAIQTLNDVTALSAAAAGSWATYVDPASTFAGHGLCGTDAWINPVHAAVTFDPTGRSVTVTTDSGSAHPTPQGQQNGYASAFTAQGFSTAR